ncbi:hypothetical protein [Streptomyces sp. CC228A]|uniref:hypothetical protein n=1 Tax=Streptomyces sp. CC228A TaxID=2898186 RepID=UPI001F4739A1|nr:hypothetical protein [Streptomyces sp. CC228A]
MSATSEELRPPRPARPGPDGEAPPGGGRPEPPVPRLTGVLPYGYAQTGQAVLAPTALRRTALRRRPARDGAPGLPLDRAPLRPAALIRRDGRTWTFAWRYARPRRDRRAGPRLPADAAGAYRRLLRGSR